PAQTPRARRAALDRAARSMALGAPTAGRRSLGARSHQTRRFMHPYRTHTCDELRTGQVCQTVRLSGWVHRKRDHGQLLFIDLRDHYGITQIVFQPEHAFFAEAERVRLESVITVTGHVVARSPDTVNPNLPTGEVEVVADAMVLEAAADTLP